MPKNYEQREQKLNNRKNQMKMNSRHLITVILPLLGKRTRESKEFTGLQKPEA